MDLIQTVTVFATGAAGCLSMAKLMQTLERRRNKKQGLAENPVKELFPNGEKLGFIRAIKDLQRENECRRDENGDLKASVDRIAAHLGIKL